MEPGSEVPFIPDLDDLAGLPLVVNFDNHNNGPVPPLAQVLPAIASGAAHPLSSTSTTSNVTITPTDYGTFVGGSSSSTSSFISKPTSKRKPLPTDIPVATMSTTKSANGDELQRDPDYYFSDGSCVLQVEDTLFNVHRTMLRKDSSFFEGMFDLPDNPESHLEGASDSCPIKLSGDTASEFRNFLWALYALPSELMVVHTAHADLTKLIDIARIAHKYTYKTTESWCLDAIHAYLQRKPSSSSPFALTSLRVSTSSTSSSSSSSSSSPGLSSVGFSGSISQLSGLVRLAVMCEHPTLLRTMVGTLKDLMGTSIQFAYLGVRLADELDIKELRGIAYMEIMHKPVAMRHSITASEGDDTHLNEGDIDNEGRLVISPEQQLRLLSGYYNLTRMWETLRTQAVPFEHSAACTAQYHMHACAQSWVDFWKEKTKVDAVLSLGLADVIGRLRALTKELERWGSVTYMHHDCRLAAKRAIQTRIESVQETLSDFFLDP